MKTVGIIGGLGPETTAEFYLEVSFGCFQKNKERRPGKNNKRKRPREERGRYRRFSERFQDNRGRNQSL